MIDSIGHKKDLFLVNYIEIGNSHAMSSELLMEHSQFADECMVGRARVGRGYGVYEVWWSCGGKVDRENGQPYLNSQFCENNLIANNILLKLLFKIFFDY